MVHVGHIINKILILTHIYKIQIQTPKTRDEVNYENDLIAELISFGKYIRPTLVTPMVPTFSPKVFVPLPHPQNPARTVPRPSVPIPLLIA